MSRSNVKSRLPNKTSRSTLPNNTKIPGELTGQPSIKNTKEDIKYWKNREQELMSKIAELEVKISSIKDSKPQEHQSDTVADHEKSENNSPELLCNEPEKSGIKSTKVNKYYKSKLCLTANELWFERNKKQEQAKEKENHKSKQGIEKEPTNSQGSDVAAEPNLKNFKNSDEVISYLKLQNEDLRNALSKMTAILRDKTTMCISQEKKIEALVNQVESLKEVVAITKDLLNIRNMEVQHLSNDITAVETKIDCERQRHNQMLIKMDEAVKLNSELKKEYENQLKLFQHLRDSYEKKILLLSRDAGEKEAEKSNSDPLVHSPNI